MPVVEDLAFGRARSSGKSAIEAYSVPSMYQR
jgi:hypothetical protein